MNAEEAVQRYPDLKGLYIPHKGEIIRWGKGYAITTQSPLDSEDRLMVISLNTTRPTEPFEVHKQLAMGPYEALSLGEQSSAVDYLNHNFDHRVLKLFEERPWVEDLWNEYRRPIKYKKPKEA